MDDNEYLLYRTLKTDPRIMEQFRKRWKLIHSIPIHQTYTYIERESSNSKERIHSTEPLGDFTQTTLTANSDWPFLVLFAEELLTHPGPIYYVNVNFDYFQTYLMQGRFPELKCEITELQNPIIVPYHDRYSYHSIVKSRDELFKIEDSDSGSSYVLTSALNNDICINLYETNMYPTREENYSACFTNKYIASMYSESVNIFLHETAKRILNRTKSKHI